MPYLVACISLPLCSHSGIQLSYNNPKILTCPCSCSSVNQESSPDVFRCKSYFNVTSACTKRKSVYNVKYFLFLGIPLYTGFTYFPLTLSRAKHIHSRSGWCSWTRSLGRTKFRQIVIEISISCFCRQMDGYEDENIVWDAPLFQRSRYHLATKVGSTTWRGRHMQTR
jgi:hypothetical protein